MLRLSTKTESMYRKTNRIIEIFNIYRKSNSSWKQTVSEVRYGSL